MIASGMMGFEPSSYRDLIKLDKLGAVVTAGISWKPRGPAHGPRVIASAGGFLLHTGLPNPGVRQVIQDYGKSWTRSPAPIIAHLIATSEAEVKRCAEVLDGVPGVAGIELGLHDQVHVQEIPLLINAVRERCQLPLLVKLPLYFAPYLAKVTQDAGADALVVASQPRGTDRDADSGRLVGGRVYGVWLKAQTLRAVGQIAQVVQIPIIACGGVHNPGDARDFIEAGAKAVQIDTLTWIQPSMVEIIARNLGGLELTRAVGALADEWQPGLGKTQAMNPKASTPAPTSKDLPPEIDLPEYPPRGNDSNRFSNQ
jgi:dihydroorotate dehydrogenase (NAD+) catalytic subunit